MPSLTQTVSPAQAAVRLAVAKDYLRITGTDEDAELARLVEAATREAESQTRRQAITATWRQKHDDLADPICLFVSPVLAITAITYLDSSGVSRTLASDQYQLVEAEGPARIIQAYGCTWPSVRGDAECVTVTYTAGYGPAPENLPAHFSQLILYLTEHFYSQRSAAVIGTIVNELPFAIRSLILGLRTPDYP